MGEKDPFLELSMKHWVAGKCCSSSSRPNPGSRSELQVLLGPSKVKGKQRGGERQVVGVGVGKAVEGQA